MATEEQILGSLVALFLADLAHANHSPQTLRAYASDLAQLCSFHQLRRSHATELINDGVSLPTIRKRLGHKNLQTTLRYAEQSDGVADAELRKWRRKHIQQEAFFNEK